MTTRRRGIIGRHASALCFLSGLLLNLSSPAQEWQAIRHALGQIESGNNDHARGRAGEVSRYQILPVVWRAEARSGRRAGDPTNEADAWLVTRSILARRMAAFRASHTGRAPSPREIYALWNSPAQAALEAKGKRLPAVLRARCERFANLVAVEQAKGLAGK
jgi:hypothetical protein